MMLDVFKSDAFSFTKLVDAINKMQAIPTRVGSLGVFGSEGVSTLSVAIEMQNGVLTLVPTAPRGAPGAAKTVERRNVRNFNTVHLPQRVAVMADEVQGLRAFGSETDEEMAMALLQKKMAVARRDLDVTHEWQRVGCLKGIVYDADGTTVLSNYLTEFGLAQTTRNVALSVNGTKVLQECVGINRTVEDKLGDVMTTGPSRVLCSPEFFDAFTGHPAVTAAYTYQMSQFLRTDNRRGFEFGDLIFEEYNGKIGATRLIAANKAYVVPMGVPDLFKSFYAPAPYMETVNTMGLPFYMKQKSLDYDVGVEWQVQSNPLHICTRPDAVIELTAT